MTILSLLACVADTTEPTPTDAPPSGAAPDRSWFGALETSGLGQSVDLIAGLDTAPIAAMRGQQYCCEGSTVWRLDPDAPSGPIADAASASVSPDRDNFRGVRYWPDLDGDGGPELVIDDGAVRFFDADAPGPSDEDEAWSLVSTYLPAETCGDLNQDGAEDFCGLGSDGRSSEAHVWLSGQGALTFGQPDWRSTPTWQFGRSLFGLVDSGGLGVLVVVDEDDGINQYGYTTFSDGLSANARTMGSEQNLVVRGDFDPGLGQEVFLARDSGQDLVLYGLAEADGGLVQTGATIEVNPDSVDYWISGGTAGDFDGDGIVDLAVTTPDDVRVFRGPFEPGHRTLAEADLHLVMPQLDGGEVAAADLDGDGRAELLVGHPKDDTLALDGGAVHFWWGSSLFP